MTKVIFRFLFPSCSDADSSSSKLRFLRPKHFKPFSHGKRSCMGYKLVENVCLVLTVAVVRAFKLSQVGGLNMGLGIEYYTGSCCSTYYVLGNGILWLM